MSAYSDWKCGALTDEEYRSAMRRECGEDFPREELPFYTDDPDDPHWRCERCAYCKTFNLRKPIIHFHTHVDDKGYVHNNPEKPVKENLTAMWSLEENYVLGNICELTHNQVMDDDYCAEFREKENGR